jgi:hypothetical protein
VWARDRAEEIIGVLNVLHPVANGFVDGVLEGPGAAGDGDDFGAEEPHPEDVKSLPAHVLLAHVDNALHAEQGGHSGRGDAMLPRSGFGQKARLSHPFRQQPLPQGVVDLVRAGVVEVLPLEVDLAAEDLAQVRGVVER